MGCGEFLVKYILFFTNLVFALGGLALLALGIAAQLRISEVTSFLAENNLAFPAISSMVVGSIVFLIAFFGCCGAIRESNCMLVTYSIIMLLLMVAKIALAVLIFVKLDDLVEKDVPKWVAEAFTRNPTEFQNLEKTLHCCGVNGAVSYLPSRLTVPDTCCEKAPCTVLNSYDGCSKVISEGLNVFGLAIGIIAIVIAAIELVATVFGLCLANHVKNKQRRQYY